MDHSMVLLNAQVQFLVRLLPDVSRECSLLYTKLSALGSSVWFGRLRSLVVSFEFLYIKIGHFFFSVQTVHAQLY
jgi:hypothetical protein